MGGDPTAVAMPRLPLVRAAKVGARTLLQSLGLLILLWTPALAADSWRPLLVDGKRLPGPGVLLRDGQPWYPMVDLGRRLKAPVGVNKVAGVVVVLGREYRCQMVALDGRIYVPEAALHSVWPQLTMDYDGLAQRVWTSGAPATATRGLQVLGITPSVQDDQLELAVELGNSGASDAGDSVLVTLLEPDGRTYAEFRQPLASPLRAGERRVVEIAVWLTPLRVVGPDQAEVELHGLGGGPPERRLIRWQVSAR